MLIGLWTCNPQIAVAGKSQLVEKVASCLGEKRNLERGKIARDENR